MVNTEILKLSARVELLKQTETANNEHVGLNLTLFAVSNQAFQIVIVVHIQNLSKNSDT